MQDFYQYLNPIHSSLERISDTSDLSPKNPLEKVEFEYLKDVILPLAEDLKAGVSHIDNLSEQIEHMIWVIDNETGDDKTEAIGLYNKLIQQMQDLVDRLNRLFDILDTPYFGKVIFERKAGEGFSKTTMPAYIGKFGYFDKSTGKALISDWRSPIANLYYNNSGPQKGVSFVSPVGTQHGDLTEKLQFDVSMGRIREIYKTESGNIAVDEFLLKELKQRSGEKLKEIVSTIQAQQNNIIRADIDSPLLIQGVAGSGKTTIILHRMAYLMYAYPEKILPKRSLVIAPNKLFIDYISDVLPSLGVKGMQQNTYLFWSRELVALSDKHVIDDTEPIEVKSIKGSILYYEHIKSYLEQFIEKFFANMPTTAAPYVEESFYEIREKHPELPFKELVDLAVESVFSTRTLNRSFSESLSRSGADKEREKHIKDYIRSNLNVYNIYLASFKDKHPNNTPLTNEQWMLITRASTQTTRKNKGFMGYATSDLAPLVMIRDFLFGTLNDMYDHILIDEAQDLSPFQIATLVVHAKKGNVTIAGDTAQSIIPPFHYKEWSGLIEFLSNIAGLEVQYHDLNKSYRSTQQIIEFSTKILASEFPKTYKLPEAVLRTGDDVIIDRTDDIIKNDPEAFKSLLKAIKEEIETKAPSVAVICRDDIHSDLLYSLISQEDLGLQVYSHQMENFHDGIQVLPVRMAKGLEFSSVIVVDLAKEFYDNEEEARLLYVSFTRALHRLRIIAPKSGVSRFLDSIS
ncbi:UvrD-helicase domain-containing protein [Candidatus Nomurabacteria bacterium]|uniref:UvrD-helicase domain-containing protein n=1 Tax=Candidatus Dojkabacteria bacterium TaxID=2099670 RepID=A0A955I197_9BACT|nr:UvrD-helicase domain-containing protein [Candidatus Dojkabacteria bacterium]MCB9790139.1 UvrD-helicase domain-containing protein [Candidatus Nomurabacteria bacterium]MCB9803341.1 UvrD-helicase domain-containing protein [Candidatus Nomurabacteria bacterium]